MQDDNLPATPDDNNDRLPARAQQDNLPARRGGQAISVDLFDDRRADEDEIDLLAYWRILLKRRWLVLGVLGSVVALSLLVTLMMPPVYRSTATLQIDRESMQAMQVEGFNNAEGAAPDFLTTQYELLRSRALAERVANELQIDATTAQRLRSNTWWQRATAALRADDRQASPGDADADPASDELATLQAATGIVRDGLTVEPVRNSRLVRVHYDSTLPAFSARVANAVAEGFISAAIERKFDASSYA